MSIIGRDGGLVRGPGDKMVTRLGPVARAD